MSNRIENHFVTIIIPNLFSSLCDPVTTQIQDIFFYFLTIIFECVIIIQENKFKCLTTEDLLGFMKNYCTFATFHLDGACFEDDIYGSAQSNLFVALSY